MQDKIKTLNDKIAEAILGGWLKRIAKQAGLTEKNSLIISFDLADTTQAPHYAKQIIDKFGRIDILINNGGQSQSAEAIAVSEKKKDKLFEIK